ncbi:MAG: hypothetical protein ACRDD1_18460, partial [Planctomycetia bacterium]
GCDVVRDVVGNPFPPPVDLSPWRTPLVVELAEAIYQTRDYGLMPVLADALEEAGCGNEVILDHARAAKPHVHGCWLLGALTGRV